MERTMYTSILRGTTQDVILLLLSPKHASQRITPQVTLVLLMLEWLP